MNNTSVRVHRQNGQPSQQAEQTRKTLPTKNAQPKVDFGPAESSLDSIRRLAGRALGATVLAGLFQRAIASG